jgi:hypothetical protein
LYETARRKAGPNRQILFAGTDDRNVVAAAVAGGRSHSYSTDLQEGETIKKFEHEHDYEQEIERIYVS